MDKPMTSAEVVSRILQAATNKRQQHLAVYGKDHTCDSCDQTERTLKALHLPPSGGS